MRVPRSKAIWWSAILIVASSGYLAFRVFRPRIDDRVYSIGFQNSPPFQQRAADGSPAGLSIDLVRDAARRRGIRLKWVWVPGNSEAALRSREVDLWPLITITPERRKVIHISKPYLQHDYTLTVLAGSRYSRVADLETARVSHLGIAIVKKHVNTLLPRAEAIAAPSPREVVESVCAGASDAAFLDEFTSSALLVSGLSCPSQPLRMIPVPNLRTELGVGATPEAAAVADAIRSGIDLSLERGDLAAVLKSAGYFSPRNMDYFSAMLEARRQQRLLIAITSIIAVFLISTAFAAERIRRQRNQIRAAERALRESEHKLRLLANNLSDMVLAYDMDRRLVFANPAVERITGYSASELQDRQFLACVHPDDRALVSARWEELFRGGVTEDQEHRLIARDGRLKWLATAWGSMYDDAGRQIGIQGSARDITERKLGQESLRESERRFRELLERVQLVAVMTDLTGTITFCNDYTLSLTGWSRDEVVGHLATKFRDAQVLAREEELAAVAPHERSPFFEGAIRCKNGSTRWVQWSSAPLRDSEGRASGFASIGEDVTELRALRAEAARRESEEQFQTVADTSPLMIWVAGRDMRCTFVNKGWLAFSGRNLEDELGDGWIETVHPDDRERCLATYAAAFNARRSFQLEKRVRRADGEYRWILSSGVPRYQPGGEFAGYVGNFNDITDLKRRHDEDIARQKLESVGRLAGGIAHDVNNLLGAVLAQADVALADVADGVSPTQPLDQIRAAAVRGAGIVRQLLIYSGQDNAVSEPVDVSFLVGEMVELLRVVVSKRALLKTEFATGLPAVRANPAQLRQVVMNLVTNASEAITDRDGIITIRTAVAGASVTLEVSDTGSGIAPDAQAKLFDPFFTTKPAGHGLGLAVVRQIVQGIGGEVRFETKPAAGTTFHVLMPFERTAGAPHVVAGARPAEEWNHPGPVLIVEDEALLRAAVARMLRKRGVRVLEAADGTVALRFIHDSRQSISIVLLDITLPGVSSRDVFAESRRLRPWTKVVVTSAYGQNQLDNSFPGMKIDAFIRKPYQLTDLLAVLREQSSLVDDPASHSAMSR